MKNIILLLFILPAISCNFSTQTSTSASKPTTEVSKDTILMVLDNWHKAAAEANFETYFDVMAPDGVL